jgi:hypothetical protein
VSTGLSRTTTVADEQTVLEQQLAQAKADAARFEKQEKDLNQMVTFLRQGQQTGRLRPEALPDEVVAGSRYAELKSAYENAILNSKRPDYRDISAADALKLIEQWIQEVHLPQLDAKWVYAAEQFSNATNDVARLEARLKDVRAQAATGKWSSPTPTAHQANEQDTLEWQLAQARNEQLQAKNKVANGELVLHNAEEKLDGQPDSKQLRSAIDEAAAALTLAKEQEVHWSKEVARIEATLNERQSSPIPLMDYLFRLNNPLRSAESNLARIHDLYDRKLVSQSDYEAAQLARDLAAAELKHKPPLVVRLKRQQAEQEFKRVEANYTARLASQEEYEKAKRSLDDAIAE